LRTPLGEFGVEGVAAVLGKVQWQIHRGDQLTLHGPRLWRLDPGHIGIAHHPPRETMLALGER
jgi:hypothetical protein